MSNKAPVVTTQSAVFIMSDVANDRVVARILCAECGKRAAFVESVPPGLRPHDFPTWSEDNRCIYEQHYGASGKWHFIFEGIGGGNGFGDDIGTEAAERIARGFADPLTYTKVHTAGLYDDAGFCQRCDAPYCYAHWREFGEGFCPRGHWKSLDPHWSPDWAALARRCSGRIQQPLRCFHQRQLGDRITHEGDRGGANGF